MHVVVFVTAKDMREAKKIADTLVEKKLIACANIIKGIESVFWWEGKVDRSKEVLLIMKTKRSVLARVVKAVKACHSYSVPEVIALPIIAGNRGYLRWIDASVG